MLLLFDMFVIHKPEMEEWYEDVAQAMKGRAMLQWSNGDHGRVSWRLKIVRF